MRIIKKRKVNKIMNDLKMKFKDWLTLLQVSQTINKQSSLLY
jgi:hypothetical protein